MTPKDFEGILAHAAEILTENIRTNKDYHSPEAFERHALDMLKVAARGRGLAVEPSFHPRAFPDIRANGFGVEVKYTKNDTWLAVGNSIFEGMRDPGVDAVYILFGKIGGVPEVRWGRYENCVTHVRVSNSPRFVVEMETNRRPLFEQFKISYDDFAKLSEQEKMRHVREYSRKRIKRGERLWWLDPSHSIPIEVRPYVNLPDEEKRVLRAEAALLCPQICGPSHGPLAQRKYMDVGLYLLMHHGVFSGQTRDLFSAGSVADRVAKIHDNEPFISRALRAIERPMIDAAGRLDGALFEEYWGKSCPPDLRISEWLEMADRVAKGWRPSDNLFLDKAMRIELDRDDGRE